MSFVPSFIKKSLREALLTSPNYQLSTSQTSTIETTEISIANRTDISLSRDFEDVVRQWLETQPTIEFNPNAPNPPLQIADIQAIIFDLFNPIAYNVTISRETKLKYLEDFKTSTSPGRVALIQNIQIRKPEDVHPNLIALDSFLKSDFFKITPEGTLENSELDCSFTLYDIFKQCLDPKSNTSRHLYLELIGGYVREKLLNYILTNVLTSKGFKFEELINQYNANNQHLNAKAPDIDARGIYQETGDAYKIHQELLSKAYAILKFTTCKNSLSHPLHQVFLRDLVLYQQQNLNSKYTANQSYINFSLGNQNARPLDLSFNGRSSENILNVDAISLGINQFISLLEASLLFGDDWAKTNIEVAWAIRTKNITISPKGDLQSYGKAWLTKHVKINKGIPILPAHCKRILSFISRGFSCEESQELMTVAVNIPASQIAYEVKTYNIKHQNNNLRESFVHVLNTLIFFAKIKNDSEIVLIWQNIKTEFYNKSTKTSYVENLRENLSNDLVKNKLLIDFLAILESSIPFSVVHDHMLLSLSTALNTETTSENLSVQLTNHLGTSLQCKTPINLFFPYTPDIACRRLQESEYSLTPLDINLLQELISSVTSHAAFNPKINSRVSHQGVRTDVNWNELFRQASLLLKSSHSINKIQAYHQLLIIQMRSTIQTGELLTVHALEILELINKPAEITQLFRSLQLLLSKKNYFIFLQHQFISTNTNTRARALQFLACYLQTLKIQDGNRRDQLTLLIGLQEIDYFKDCDELEEYKLFQTMALNCPQEEMSRLEKSADWLIKNHRSHKNCYECTSQLIQLAQQKLSLGILDEDVFRFIEQAIAKKLIKKNDTRLKPVYHLLIQTLIKKSAAKAFELFCKIVLEDNIYKRDEVNTIIGQATEFIANQISVLEVFNNLILPAIGEQPQRLSNTGADLEKFAIMVLEHVMGLDLSLAYQTYRNIHKYIVFKNQEQIKRISLLHTQLVQRLMTSEDPEEQVLYTACMQDILHKANLKSLKDFLLKLDTIDQKNAITFIVEVHQKKLLIPQEEWQFILDYLKNEKRFKSLNSIEIAILGTMMITVLKNLKNKTAKTPIIHKFIELLAKTHATTAENLFQEAFKSCALDSTPATVSVFTAILNALPRKSLDELQKLENFWRKYSKLYLPLNSQAAPYVIEIAKSFNGHIMRGLKLLAENRILFKEEGYFDTCYGIVSNALEHYFTEALDGFTFLLAEPSKLNMADRIDTLLEFIFRRVTLSSDKPRAEVIRFLNQPSVIKGLGNQIYCINAITYLTNNEIVKNENALNILIFILEIVNLNTLSKKLLFELVRLIIAIPLENTKNTTSAINATVKACPTLLTNLKSHEDPESLQLATSLISIVTHSDKTIAKSTDLIETTSWIITYIETTITTENCDAKYLLINQFLEKCDFTDTPYLQMELYSKVVEIFLVKPVHFLNQWFTNLLLVYASNNICSTEMENAQKAILVPLINTHPRLSSNLETIIDGLFDKKDQGKNVKNNRAIKAIKLILGMRKITDARIQKVLSIAQQHPDIEILRGASLLLDLSLDEKLYQDTPNHYGHNLIKLYKIHNSSGIQLSNPACENCLELLNSGVSIELCEDVIKLWLDLAKKHQNEKFSLKDQLQALLMKLCFDTRPSIFVHILLSNALLEELLKMPNGFEQNTIKNIISACHIYKNISAVGHNYDYIVQIFNIAILYFFETDPNNCDTHLNHSINPYDVGCLVDYTYIISEFYWTFYEQLDVKKRHSKLLFLEMLCSTNFPKLLLLSEQLLLSHLADQKTMQINDYEQASYVNIFDSILNVSNGNAIIQHPQLNHIASQETIAKMYLDWMNKMYSTNKSLDVRTFASHISPLHAYPELLLKGSELVIEFLIHRVVSHDMHTDPQRVFIQTFVDFNDLIEVCFTGVLRASIPLEILEFNSNMKEYIHGLRTEYFQLEQVAVLNSFDVNSLPIYIHLLLSLLKKYEIAKFQGIDCDEKCTFFLNFIRSCIDIIIHYKKEADKIQLNKSSNLNSAAASLIFDYLMSSIWQNESYSDVKKMRLDLLNVAEEANVFISFPAKMYAIKMFLDQHLNEIKLSKKLIVEAVLEVAKSVSREQQDPFYLARGHILIHKHIDYFDSYIEQRNQAFLLIFQGICNNPLLNISTKIRKDNSPETTIEYRYVFQKHLHTLLNLLPYQQWGSNIFKMYVEKLIGYFATTNSRGEFIDIRPDLSYYQRLLIVTAISTALCTAYKKALEQNNLTICRLKRGGIPSIFNLNHYYSCVYNIIAGCVITHLNKSRSLTADFNEEKLNEELLKAVDFTVLFNNQFLGKIILNAEEIKQRTSVFVIWISYLVSRKSPICTARAKLDLEKFGHVVHDKTSLAQLKASVNG